MTNPKLALDPVGLGVLHNALANIAAGNRWRPGVPPVK